MAENEKHLTLHTFISNIFFLIIAAMSPPSPVVDLRLVIGPAHIRVGGTSPPRASLQAVWLSNGSANFLRKPRLSSDLDP